MHVYNFWLTVLKALVSGVGMWSVVGVAVAVLIYDLKKHSEQN